MSNHQAMAILFNTYTHCAHRSATLEEGLAHGDNAARVEEAARVVFDAGPAVLAAFGNMIASSLHSHAFSELQRQQPAAEGDES